MIRYLIFDTETTGLPKKNDFSLINMIELGYIILDEDFKIIKESNNLIKGEYEIPEFITKLTGITKSKIDENGNSINIVLKEFINDDAWIFKEGKMEELVLLLERAILIKDRKKYLENASLFSREYFGINKQAHLMDKIFNSLN